MNDIARDDTPDPELDPIDEEAAEIDARSPDAPEKIEELIDHADEEALRPHR